MKTNHSSLLETWVATILLVAIFVVALSSCQLAYEVSR